MVLDRKEPNYFGAGPAQLPTSVLQQAAKELIDFQEVGLGIGEISHRSKEAVKVIEDTKSRVRELLSVPQSYEIFFIQGGGTTGFSSVATNLTAASVGRNGFAGTAAYMVTGMWSQKAFQEAERLGINTEILFNTKHENGAYNSIPPVAEWIGKISKERHSYVYLCENETVHGVEWREVPKALAATGVPLVADLSSNIFSRKIDIERYGLIIAGAQKNIGLAGLTLYIVRKTLLYDILKVPDRKLLELGVPVSPIGTHYPTVVSNNSTYNTIPLFTLRIIDLVLERLLERGGIERQEAENEEKAGLLYDTIERFPDFYNLPVSKDVRSRMNIVFTIKKEGLETKFLKGAADLNLTGLQGHRSVGGFRASLYNAVEISSVRLLADYVSKFAQDNA